MEVVLAVTCLDLRARPLLRILMSVGAGNALGPLAAAMIAEAAVLTLAPTGSRSSRASFICARSIILRHAPFGSVTCQQPGYLPYIPGQRRS